MKTILSFYTWWPPEKDLGAELDKSLNEIGSLGFSAISYDIQHNWLLSSRKTWETLLQKCEERGLLVVPVVSYGLLVVPVVSYGYLPNAAALSELTGMGVTTAVDSAGSATNTIDVHDLRNVEPFAHYLKELIETYGNSLVKIGGRTLLNFWEPSMVDWSSMPRRHLGYDDAAVQDFRDWASARCNVDELNERRETHFSTVDDIQPPVRGLWEERREIVFIEPNRFWDDWCLFRADILARFYAELFRKIKEESKVEIAVGLSQHGIITQHDSFHQRCIYLPYWTNVPADKFIVSDDLYCKSPSEVGLCLEGEIGLFQSLFGDRVTAFLTPVEGNILVQEPDSLFSRCRDLSTEYIYLYAWNEMADGATIRLHPEIWPQIKRVLSEFEA